MKNGNAKTGLAAVLDRPRTMKSAIKVLKAEKREVYLSPPNVQLYPFDSVYLRLLQEGDPATEAHFCVYFSDLLRIKLRSRQLAAADISEISQETFTRVLEAVRAGAIREPDRLGAFVNSTCNNILQESYRRRIREQHVDLDSVEIPDLHIDLQGTMEAEEKNKDVRTALNRMEKRDRQILLALFFDERDKDDVCREFKVKREYLRVLLHRAKGNFRSRFGRGAGN